MNQKRIKEIQSYLFQILGYKMPKQEIIGLAECESVDSLRDTLVFELSIYDLEFSEIEELYFMLS